MRVVYQLVMEFLANFKVTKAINAREAKFTPSRILEKTFDRLDAKINSVNDEEGTQVNDKDLNQLQFCYLFLLFLLKDLYQLV